MISDEEIWEMRMEIQNDEASERESEREDLRREVCGIEEEE